MSSCRQHPERILIEQIILQATVSHLDSGYGLCRDAYKQVLHFGLVAVVLR